VALCGILLLGCMAAFLYGYYTYNPSKPRLWQLGLIAFSWLASACGVWQFLRHISIGDLDFDGAHWYFGENQGALSVRFDGQNCLLVRFDEARSSKLNRSRWLWLEERFDPRHWHDLRRAVYSRAESVN
jgi:toxin CptA